MAIRKGLLGTLGILFLLSLSVYGQPFPSEVYRQRRQALMAKMNGGIAVFRSAKPCRRNGDVDYEFRQDSDFFYLTGINEPGAVLVLCPEEKHQSILFVRQLSQRRARYMGQPLSVQKAMKVFGMDTALAMNEFERQLSRLVGRAGKVYFPFQDQELFTQLSSTRNRPASLHDPTAWIHEMRVKKDSLELTYLRRAIAITCEAHREAMKLAGPGLFEYELEAMIEYVFRRNGAAYPAFPTIVGSGPNSTILHYEKNSRRMENGDLVLMDIGAEYMNYAADVTRTIPVNGKFTPEQRQIYEIVLQAEKETISMVKPGADIRAIQTKPAEVMAQGLFKLGLITDPNSRWQARLYTIHGTSHWIGLDVHDVGSYGRKLEPGMIFTVEPGIYVDENTLANLEERLRNRVPMEELEAFRQKVLPIARKYFHIGIRIEDDVLVTETGHEVVSKAAPREIEEIEQLMKQ